MGNIKDRLTAECVLCGDLYPLARKTLAGKDTCLSCGDIQATKARSTWCVAPASNKQGYTLHRSADTLRQINPKQSERWT